MPSLLGGSVPATLAGAVAIPTETAGRGAAIWSRAAGTGARWGLGRQLEDVSMRMFKIALVAIFGFGTLASAFGTFGVGVVALVGTVSGVGTLSGAVGLLWVLSILVAGAHSGMRS